MCSETGAAVVPVRCIANALMSNGALDACEFTPCRRVQQNFEASVIITGRLALSLLSAHTSLFVSVTLFEFLVRSFLVYLIIP